MINRSQMIAECYDMERKMLAALYVDLKECKTILESNQCRDTYYRLINENRDRICQSYGASAAAFYREFL